MRLLLSIITIIMLAGCNDSPATSRPCSNEPYDWSFVHISDVHIGTDQGEEHLTALVPIINAINPAFVINTGDTSNDAEFDLDLGRQEWNTYLNIVQALTMPVYNAPGNHDLGWTSDTTSRQAYEEVFGTSFQSFVHNGIRFIIADDIPTSKSSPAVVVAPLNDVMTFVAVHIPPAHINTNILAGHLHIMTTTRTKDYIQITAPALKDNTTFLVYKVRHDDIEVCTRNGYNKESHRVALIMR